MKTSLLFLLCLFLAARIPCRAQTFDVQQLLLDVEKLSELKQILQDLKDGYQVLQSGYSAIRDVAKGSFNLHKAYLDGLLAASPTMRGYARIGAIADMQVQLIQRYQAAWARFRQDANLRPGEISALGQAFGAVLNGCAEDLGDLVVLVTDGMIRASDEERMQEVDTIYYRVKAKLAFVGRICDQIGLLSLQRAAEVNDLSFLQQWLGVTP